MIKKKMQNSFIKLLSFFIIIVLVTTLLLFYSTMQYVFFNYISQTNEHLVSQIVSTFELVVEQVANKAYKYGIYDNDLVRLVKERDQGVMNRKKLYETLNSIVLENEYLDSAYLFSEKDQIVFDSKTGCSYKIDDFYDKDVVGVLNQQRFSRAEPHKIQRISGTTDLLYSIIVVLPEKTTDGAVTSLSFNIDMNKVYQDIMRRNDISRDGRLYIYNEKSQILVSDDDADFGRSIEKMAGSQTADVGKVSFWNIISKKSGVINAFGSSGALGWNFCMQVPYEINISSMINKYVAFLFVCVILVLFLIIIYIVMRHTTRPLDSFLDNYDETIVKNLLTDSNFTRDKSSMERECMERLFRYDSFLVALVEAAEISGELLKLITTILPQICPEDKKVMVNPVMLYHGRVAILCNYHAGTLNTFVEHTFLERLSSSLKENGVEKSYIAVSTVKSGYGELAMAVRECEEILEYKLSLPKRLMRYDSFAALKGGIEYPVNYEKQLINNLMAANLESCIFYLDKFIDHLFHNHSIISDMYIKNYVYQLQTELLKHISSLPLSIKTSNGLDLKAVPDKEYIYENLSELIHTICSEITKKNSNNENVLVQSILEYIHEHLTDNDFNLNTVSYQFNMNRNYLARMIKETTSYAFNDYVNFKKIELAKEKLGNTSMTIEQIASEVGFSYSHYFIKVFKSVEGVTPGTYRKMLAHNNVAQE